jgi:hypothetical protein
MTTSAASSLKRPWIDPPDFEPYEDLTICSNRLINNRHILELENGVHPIIIGKGREPNIWLAAPVDQARSAWRFVIERSVSLHPAFSIESRISSSKPIFVRAGKTIVIRISSFSENAVVIDEIDLRPIGLNIFGTTSVLQVGGAKMVGNSFANMGVAIGIG